MPQIGTAREFGQLLKTNQTTQYNSYPDDGYFRRGLSRLYTILTAAQYAGTTNITLNAKTDVHSNNCVYDQRTKLVWSRTSSASIGPASDGKIPWTTNGNGEGIFPYAAAANLAKLAGYSDWRIPNLLEAFSLLTFEAPAISVDLSAFPSLPGITIYSSTTRPSSITNAIGVILGGNAIALTAKTSNNYCLLVRG